MLFEFNIYSTLLLVAFLQGIIFAIILYKRGKKQDRLSDQLLAIILLLCCLYIAQYMLGFGGWYDSRDWHSTFMFYFPFHVLLLIAPLIYFYFRSLTNLEFRFRKKDAWHFGPGALLIMLYLIIFLKDVLLENGIHTNPFPLHFETQGYWSAFRQNHIPTVEIGCIATMIYTIWTIIVYRKYRKYINNNFSETTAIEFNWIKWLLYAVVFGFAINFIVNTLGQMFSFDYKAYWASYFALAVMIYFLSIQGFISVQKLSKPLLFVPEVQEPVKTDLNNIEQWKNKLDFVITNERPYLRPDLTLNELARLVDTNTSIISKVINTGYQQNFNDFINRLRIEAVIAKMQTHELQRFTLMSIAFDCGFNSKATFNRAFHKFKGCSPSEYLKQQHIVK